MNKYMKIAKELSENNLKTNNGGPFGACVVKNNQIIGSSSNQVISNNDPTAHAEIMAIRNACKSINSYDLSDCELYTTCYPCPMCLSAIIWANIKKVYYGNSIEDAERIGFRDKDIYNIIKEVPNIDNKKLSIQCVDKNETIQVFDKFNNNDNPLY